MTSDSVRAINKLPVFMLLGIVTALLISGRLPAQTPPSPEPSPAAAGTSPELPDDAPVDAQTEAPADAPVDAQTEAPADAQRIDALIRRERLHQAESLAQRRMDAVELAAEDAAKWAVALSNVRLAKLLRAPLADQPAHLLSATEPLDRVLNAYPDHRRAAWLRFQRDVVDLVVARRQTAIWLATPGDETQRLALVATLLRTAESLQELERQIAEDIAAAFQRRDRSAWIDELMALRSAIAVKRVEILLRRGELFAAGSDDFLAAAGEAAQAAVDALALVRQDPLRRDELVRMRCEALLRIGQPDRAAELLRPLMAAERRSGRLDDATLALAVRVALDLDQTDQAAQLLAAHYGDRPAEAPASPESDLARLRFLIATGASDAAGGKRDQQAIGDWIAAVRQRGGDFAQRRAETILAETLGGQPGAASDDRMVIAAAATKLRQGQSLAAAEMLDDAARRAGDAAAAGRLAVAAAAAYDHAGNPALAVQLLRAVANAHDQHAGSAKLLLQAAVLLSRIEQAQSAGGAAATVPTGGDPINELLRQITSGWPNSAAALDARGWLVARLRAAGKPVEAAIAGSPGDGQAATDEQWDEAARLWIDALVAVPPLTEDFSLNPASGELMRQAIEHLQGDWPAAQRWRKRMIVLGGEVGELAALDAADLEHPFFSWLLRVRRGGQAGPAPTEALSGQTRQAAVQRLLADGIAAEDRQAQLAAAILPLVENEITAAKAFALLWSGDWQSADAVLDQWVADHPDGEAADAAITAARLLAHSSLPAAKRRALQRYHAVGAQLMQGSDSWHQVKLATIELFSALGQTEEASRLAKYILLTRPPNDPAFQASYRRWAEP